MQYLPDRGTPVHDVGPYPDILIDNPVKVLLGLINTIIVWRILVAQDVFRLNT